MNRTKSSSLILLVFLAITSGSAFAQSHPTLQDNTNPWSAKQLMEPAQLAALLKNAMAVKPHIYNIGVVQNIQGSNHVGAASQEANLRKLKSTVTKLPRATTLVLYCGCCPLDKCPNVRPAFKLVKEMGFTQVRLLNLRTNIKTDWINKGYPMEL